MVSCLKMSFGRFDDPWPDDRSFPVRKHKRNRNQWRTYSKEERSEDLSFYEPFSLEIVEMGKVALSDVIPLSSYQKLCAVDYADDEDKPEALASLLCDIVNDASVNFFAYDIETEMRSKV